MLQSRPIQRIGLRVRDLQTQLAYYQKLGLSVVRDQRKEGLIGLGAGTREFLTLRHVPDALPRPAQTTGLYHLAMVVPDEATLAACLRYCLDGHVPLNGSDGINSMANHYVSKSLYFTDPEGNGVEIYADTPQESWIFDDNHRPTLGRLPLDTDELHSHFQTEYHGMPAGSVLGHVHINVADLEASLSYYQNTFGLLLFPSHGGGGQAGFISWDGLYHHIAMNTWNGPFENLHQPTYLGLDFVEFALPVLPAGTYIDPNGINIVVTG